MEVFEKNGIRLTTKKFTLQRGGKETVAVTLKATALFEQTPGPQAGTPLA